MKNGFYFTKLAPSNSFGTLKLEIVASLYREQARTISLGPLASNSFMSEYQEKIRCSCAFYISKVQRVILANALMHGALSMHIYIIN